MLYKKLFLALFLFLLTSCSAILGPSTSIDDCNTVRKISFLEEFCGQHQCMGMTREAVYEKIGRPDRVFDDISGKSKKPIIAEEYTALGQHIWRRTFPEKIFGKEELVTRENMAPYCYYLYLSYFPGEDIVVGVGISQPN